MRVSVRFFAVAKDLAGSGELALEVPEQATVGMLRRALADGSPRWPPLLSSLMVAVDSEYAPDGLKIPPEAEVAVIPPVSGG